MEEQYRVDVALREIRNVPETVNATVDFIRLHRKGLLRLLLTRAFPVLLFGQIINEVVVNNSLGLESPYAADMPSRLLTLLGLIICYGFGYSILIGIVYSYTRFTLTYGPDEFNEEDVWESTKESFWKIFGTLVGLGALGLILLLIAAGIARGVPIVGVLLVFITMIFVSTVWSLYAPARFSDNYGFFAAFGRSQRLVQGRFWATFGLLVFWGLLVIILSMLPLILSAAQGGLLTYVDINWDFEGIKIPLVILVLILSALSQALYAMPLISMAFHYYSQVERKEFPMIEEGLAEMGRATEEEKTGEQSAGEPHREMEEEKDVAPMMEEEEGEQMKEEDRSDEEG